VNQNVQRQTNVNQNLNNQINASLEFNGFKNPSIYCYFNTVHQIYIKIYLDLVTNHNLSRLHDFDNFIQQYQIRRSPDN
jgi:hypothetical protein